MRVLRDELEELAGHVGEQRLVPEERRRQPVHRLGLRRARRAAGLMKRWNSRPDGMRLTSSMQPISISRSPPFGLRPVVSVSRMISRMRVSDRPQDSRIARVKRRLPSGARRPSPGRPRNSAMTASSAAWLVVDVAARVHNEIGARALFRIRHLARQQLVELFRRHPGPLQQAGALHLGRGADDDRHVDQLVGAGLEQQRNLQHGDLGAALRPARAGRRARLAHQRMHDRLQLAKARRAAPAAPR